MTNKQETEPWEDRFHKEFPCPFCDSSGIEVRADKDGEPEQWQCERCYTERFPIMKFISQILSTQKSELIKRIDEVVYKIKRYTHDRSGDGYSDVMGSCGSPCYQCNKDKKLIDDILSLLNNKN